MDVDGKEVTISDGHSPVLEDSESHSKNADLRFLAFGKPGTAISVSCICDTHMHISCAHVLLYFVYYMQYSNAPPVLRDALCMLYCIKCFNALFSDLLYCAYCTCIAIVGYSTVQYSALYSTA